MAYELDFSNLSLAFLQKRLHEEDLIPSQLPLTKDLDMNMAQLSTCGIHSLEELFNRLQTPKRLQLLAEESGIPKDYLSLLLRVLKGYRPKPQSLALITEYAGKLKAVGLRSSKDLWRAAHLKKDRVSLAQQLGFDEETLSMLASLCDLCRLQWVSALFARLILQAGYLSVGAVAQASKEELVRGVAEANKTLTLFKGKIGERDMGRLIYVATLMNDELEL